MDLVNRLLMSMSTPVAKKNGVISYIDAVLNHKGALFWNLSIMRK